MMSLTDIPSTNPTISLTSGNKPDKTPIRQRDVSKAHKTLGVWITPNGNDAAQTEYLSQVANQISSLVATSRLNKFESFMAHRACWFLAVAYSLQTPTLSEREIHKVQTRSMSIFLPKLGLNQHFPRVVLYGPPEMGGLQLRDLYIEQGIAQIMTLLRHVYSNTTVGNMIMIAIQSLQMEAGTKVQLMTDTVESFSYITKCWISEICFMCQFQIHLMLTHQWNFHVSRQSDAFLMDIFRTSGAFSEVDLRNINAVQMHLQVVTISDIATADGQYVTADTYNAKKSSTQKSKWSRIRQLSITAKQAKLWKRAIQQHLTTSVSPQPILQRTLGQ